MNACQDQGREAGTTECEDAQKTLCNQLASNSMTTVNHKPTKQINTNKQKPTAHTQNPQTK